MTIYPEQLQQIVHYINGLNEAEKKMEHDNNIPDGLEVVLHVVVHDSDGGLLGRLVDEFGGAWSFEVVT